MLPHRCCSQSEDTCPHRKFFTIVMTLNLVGILLAALNVWTYPRKYTGALVLGNLFTAILIRNELFGRFLYLTVNTLFAKASQITVEIFTQFVKLPSSRSGLPCGFVLVAPQFFSTSAEFTLAARHLASFGSSSGSPLSSSNTGQTMM